jgi:opacity protein-like surface antigen
VLSISCRFTLALALLFVSTYAFAQDETSEITLYVGGFLGDSFIIKPQPLIPEVKAVLDDQFTVGFRYAYYFHRNFGLEGGVGFTPASIVTSAFVSGGSFVNSVIDVDTYVMQANLLYRFTQGSFVPYVTAGAGAVHFNIRTSQFGFLTPSETDFAPNVGGGFKYRLKNEYFFRLDGRVYWVRPGFDVTDDKATFGEITGGISVLFNF